VSEQHESNLSFAALWDSKYVTEGRDNLENGGLGSAEVGWTKAIDNNQELILGAWYAEGTSVEYTELQLAFAYGWSLEKFDLAAAYTWLDFDSYRFTDHELVFEIGTSVMDNLDLGAAFVYSDLAGGTFIELIVSREFEQNTFTVTPYLLLGINDGYVPFEHKGLNNLQLGISVSAPISNNAEMGAYIAYTLGLDEKPGESLDDILWMGLNLAFGN